MRRTRALAAVGGALVALGFAQPAAAYVRTRATKTEKVLYWPRPCVNMDLVMGSRPPDVSEDLFRQAANEAAAVWSSSRVACTKVFMTVTSSPATSRFVESDRVNSVQFRSDFWGRNSRDLTASVVPYPAQALAITSVWASSSSGVMVDTDVEVNAVGPQWADVVRNPEVLRSNNVHDLQNTLTHEFGHVLGLDHTCDGGGQSNNFDHLGSPVPRCPGPSTVQESTMAAIVEPGDSKRRDLAPDDIQAMCEIYPADGEPVCGPDEAGGCAVSRRSTGGGKTPLVLVALGGLAFAWVRRRRT